jgi:hypothetical protein
MGIHAHRSFIFAQISVFYFYNGACSNYTLLTSFNHIMENYLLFLCVFAGLASVGIILGGIGIFTYCTTIRSDNTATFSRIADSFSRIADNSHSAAFGINKAGIALAARLMTVPMSLDVYLTDKTDNECKKQRTEQDKKLAEWNAADLI